VVVSIILLEPWRCNIGCVPLICQRRFSRGVGLSWWT